MNQEQITIYFLNREEESYTKEYADIMTKLYEKVKTTWFLFDFFDSNEIIDKINLKFTSKAIAINAEEILDYFKEYQQIEIMKNKYSTIESQLKEYQKKAEQCEKYEKVQVRYAVQGYDLQQKCYEQEQQIEKLNEIKQNLEEQMQKLQTNQRDNKVENNRRMGDLKVGDIKIQELESQNKENSKKIEQFSQEIQQLQSDKSKQIEYHSQLSKDMEQLQQDNNQKSIQLQQFSQENYQLQQNYNQKSIQLDQEIQKSEQQQSIQIIGNLTNQIQFFQRQSGQIQGSQQSQTSLQETIYDTNNIYTEEQKQELVQKNKIYKNQIRFLENFIQKKCDNHQEERQQAKIIDEGQAINTTNQLDIFLIQLDNESFNQSIISKEFFFRNKCYKKYYKFDKELNDQNKNNKGQIMILINGQPLFIEKVYKVYKSEYEALDIILNILLIEGLIKLFENDLQSTKMKSFQFEQLNLRFPRQFLIKDQQGMYYIYQECIGNNQVDNFIPFQNSQNVDQYMSSFFKYFYFSTNKNFAITDCKLKEQKNNQPNKEIVISSIVIHSKYREGFSQLDEGIDKINKFEQSQSQAPPGSIQKYWSDQLQKCAEKFWNDLYY